MDSSESDAHVLHGLVVTCVVFIVLDTFFLALRFVSRCFIKKVPVGYDDLLLWSGYAVNIGLCAVGLVVAHIEGVGHPGADDQFHDPQEFTEYLQPLLKCLFALGPLFALGYTLPKLSLLLFYLRIFVGRVRIAIYIFMAVAVAEMLAFLISAIMYCKPVAYYWQRTGPGQCFDADSFYRVTSGLKVVIDLVLVVLPLQPLWKLQVTKIRKIGTTVVFLSSVIGVAGGIIRWIFLMVYTIEVITPRTSARLVSVVILEPSLFFIAACLPACSSLVMDILHRTGIYRLLHTSAIRPSRKTPYTSSYPDGRTSPKAHEGSEDFERLVQGECNNSKRTASPYDVEHGQPQPSIPLRELS